VKDFLGTLEMAPRCASSDPWLGSGDNPPPPTRFGSSTTHHMGVFYLNQIVDSDQPLYGIRSGRILISWG
jgi:hypothetical protein